METVGIDTTQNIRLELPVASIADRIVAHIIDYALYSGYFIIISILIQILKAAGQTGTILYIILLSPLLLYDLVCELAFNGQNAGKRVMRIKVAMLDGSQPTFMSIFIRWAFRIADNVILFGAISTITIIINGKGQRLGDIAAGTAVIKLQKTQKVDDLGDFHVPENYTPVFAESVHLSENDFKIISEIIQYRKKSGETDAIFNAMVKAKNKLKNKLGIQTQINAPEFLQHLRNDYIYFNKKS